MSDLGKLSQTGANMRLCRASQQTRHLFTTSRSTGMISLSAAFDSFGTRLWFRADGAKKSALGPWAKCLLLNRVDCGFVVSSSAISNLIQIGFFSLRNAVGFSYQETTTSANEWQTWKAVRSILGLLLSNIESSFFYLFQPVNWNKDVEVDRMFVRVMETNDW